MLSLPSRYATRLVAAFGLAALLLTGLGATGTPAAAASYAASPSSPATSDSRTVVAVADGTSDSGLLVGFEGTKRFLVFCAAALIFWMALLNLIVGRRLRGRRPTAGRPPRGRSFPDSGPDRSPAEALADILAPYHRGAP